MSNGYPSSIRMRRVYLELARLRRAANRSQADAATTLDVAPSTINRIEKGQRSITRDDLVSLLLYYKASRKIRTALLNLYDRADEPSLLTRDDLKLHDDLADWICFEQTATKIHNYQPLLVPGLLQTIPYASAVISGNNPLLGEWEVADRVAARVARQAILRQKISPRFSAMVHEAALLQDVGGSATMREQLSYLAEVAEKPAVEIQVIPMQAGAHPGLDSGPFVILDYDELPSVVHMEHKVASVYLEAAQDIETYKLAWEQLRTVALTPADSVERIKEVARGLG